MDQIGLNKYARDFLKKSKIVKDLKHKIGENMITGEPILGKTYIILMDKVEFMFKEELQILTKDFCLTFLKDSDGRTCYEWMMDPMLDVDVDYKTGRYCV